MFFFLFCKDAADVILYTVWYGSVTSLCLYFISYLVFIVLIFSI